MRDDDAGLTAFCRRAHHGLVGVLSCLVGSAAVAEELAADTLARVSDRWGRRRELASPEAWAQRTALRLAGSRRHRRRAQRRARRRDGPAADDVAGDEIDVGLRQMVSGLPQRPRDALVLVVVAGCSMDEAGEVLGCGAETVKTRSVQARQQLRSRYGHGAASRGGRSMGIGLDDRLRGSAAVPPGALDVGEVRRRARRLRWSRRLWASAAAVVVVAAAGLGVMLAV